MRLKYTRQSLEKMSHSGSSVIRRVAEELLAQLDDIGRNYPSCDPDSIHYDLDSHQTFRERRR